MLEISNRCSLRRVYRLLNVIIVESVHNHMFLVQRFKGAGAYYNEIYPISLF